MTFAKMPVDVEIARLEFITIDYSAVASGISSNTFMVLIKTEFELGKEPYMRKVSRQNVLLKKQSKNGLNLWNI